MDRSPVLMGHSMGGALVQRHLRKNGGLPAAVLVASWPSRSTLRPTVQLFRRHPREVMRALVTLSAAPAIGSTALVKDLFLTDGALIAPEELRSRLGPESLLVVFQHIPPFWHPPLRTRTPLLWLGGTRDLVTAEPIHRASAADYGADYIAVEGGNHDLMWERSSPQTAWSIHQWLVSHGAVDRGWTVEL
jgi:pimeloyl-ACP methyl ester carboxylesterase